MKLHELKGNLPRLERRVNEIRHSSTADYSEVSAAYHPRHGEKSFLLPVFSVPASELTTHTASPSQGARELTGLARPERSFFCHPDSTKDFSGAPFETPAAHQEAIPTSSTRTLFLTKAPGLMVKTHLNKRISHFVRRLKGSSVRHSVQISRECERMARAPDCPTAFAYLPESIGVVHTASDLGYLVREVTPRPYVTDPRILVPFFSLYSRDADQPEDMPILCQLIGRSRSKPLTYFARNILDPFMETWAWAFLARGLLFESHGQNTLLELDASFKVRRIVQRDFQSVPVDPVIRARRGLSTPFKKHVIGSGDYPRLIEHSLQYDRFIGHCLLRSFVNFFNTYYDIPEEETCSLIRRVFRHHIPKEVEQEFFLPGSMTLGEQAVGDNVYPLVYISTPPLYRPGY